MAVEKLKGSEALKQAYAAGIAIGQDAMTIHKENQSFGQDMDKKAYLAGITDAIEGRSLLSPTELQTALIASNSAVTKNRDSKKEEQAKLAKNFLSNWSKQKGVVSDPLGYSYKINYVGQGNAYAQYNLGWLMQKGEVENASPYAARYYFELACKGGLEKACLELERQSSTHF
ncbi:FKBP-type peptidyl-prolyl cis-trans isomerase N-terminal domain-containing protein [Providencia vermicola]|uniref:FKBP-type peptidyl-prolyl cis-trans isomerase N-terminal domain-containing protein n=1 Tax=Providencia TaxID=586 RepID=UPI00234A8B96|nr:MULTISPECIES: FKBP-type peptidyl-prolyl cis-trans isomerase N-terminal domain-containing protein [Providencia]